MKMRMILKNRSYEMLCAIWYHLYYFKNVKNTQGGVLLLVKLQALGSNFTESNTPPWVFSRFLNCANGTKLRIASHTISTPRRRHGHKYTKYSICR